MEGLPSTAARRNEALQGKAHSTRTPVKQERGTRSPGRLSSPGTSREPGHAGRGRATAVKDLPNPPYWNNDPRGRWYGPENVGYALIDGRRELVLIDSGTRANSVTPEYAAKHQLVVAPVHELADNPKSLAVVGVGGVTTALGYVIINVKIKEIPSYAEDQVALVVPDVSGLGQEVSVILGTPTIHRLTRCIEGVGNIGCSARMEDGNCQLRGVPGHEGVYGRTRNQIPDEYGPGPSRSQRDRHIKGEIHHPSLLLHNCTRPNEEDVYDRASIECHGTTTVFR